MYIHTNRTHFDPITPIYIIYTYMYTYMYHSVINEHSSIHNVACVYIQAAKYNDLRAKYPSIHRISHPRKDQCSLHNYIHTPIYTYLYTYQRCIVNAEMTQRIVVRFTRFHPRISWRRIKCRVENDESR